MVKAKCKECKGAGFHEWDPKALVLQGRSDKSRAKLAELAGDIQRAGEQLAELCRRRPEKTSVYNEDYEEYVKKAGEKMLSLAGLEPY